MDLSLGLDSSHVLVTGGNGHIGRSIVQAFLAAGALVTSIDLHPSSKHELSLDEAARFQYFCGDITHEGIMTSVFEMAADTFGVVQCCVALASLDLSVLPHHESLADMPVEQWRETHKVNVEGTFLTARTWLRQLRKFDLATRDHNSERSILQNVSLIIIGSESGTFGERSNADYASGKSAVQHGLVRSLAPDAARVWPGARVNAVAPGPVDTAQFKIECAENPEQLYLDAQATVALKRPVPVEDVSKSVLFLASENWSASVTGQVIAVDSGKTGKVFWGKDDV